MLPERSKTIITSTSAWQPGKRQLFLQSSSLFELASSGEKIGGFNIEADKTAIVTWRLGAGVNTPCTTYLIDENNNLEWDCGTDRMEFECPPEVEYMWDFVVEYK